MRQTVIILPWLVAVVLAGCGASPPVDEAILARGRTLYNNSCAACHQLDGEGKPGVASPLARSSWVVGPEERLVRIALHGVRGGIEVRGKMYNLEMPGFQYVFTKDEDMATVLTYVRSAWGNSASEVTAQTVGAVRKQFASRGDSWTAQGLLAVE